ncbi:DUF3152 domain-containing protein [Streptomyces sp. NPDC008343]|uniref:DUF3152 domain-containing protein n=1 Tax=Streptomyces sp. NPDC008343 TaxID=3364828 RepID=UPI0036EC414D
MNVPSTSSPSSNAHRRRGRRRRARRARGPRSALWAGLAAVVGLLLAGGLAWNGPTTASDDRRTSEAGSASKVQAKPSSSTSSDAGRPPSRGSAGAQKEEKDAKDERKKKEEDRSSPAIPSSGPGTFTTAQGGGDRVGGSQQVFTYRVQVEDGIGITAGEVAAEVDRVLADPRGWTADGGVGFRRVSGGTSDFRIRLATATTVDRVCGQYGLDTGGEVNCRVGQDVMVNLKRWLLATEYYTDDVTAYRALIINHEVGHFLGHGHEGCPGPGKPAPVMMQQIKGLHGCTTNVWPYDKDGRRITGPSVP